MTTVPQSTSSQTTLPAGGLDRDLGKEIVIFRRDDAGATRRIAVDLERLVYHADPELNLVIEPGDIVYVPTVEKVRIFVSGAVRNPDLYEVPREEPVTVLKAITLAGGIVESMAAEVETMQSLLSRRREASASG